MYKRTRWGFAALAIIIALGVYLLNTVPLKKGIDLVGGTLLTYSLDLSHIDDNRAGVAEEVKDIIARRLNAYGLREISVQVQGDDHLIIRLPGTDAQSVEAIKDTIRRAGNLTFRLGVDLGDSDLDTIEAEEATYLADDRAWVREKLVATSAGGPFTKRRPEPPREIVRWHVKTSDTGETTRTRHALGNAHYYDDASGEWVAEDIVDGSYLARVNGTVDENFRNAVAFTFQGEGAARFGDLTGKNIGRPLTILLDDEIMQIATIQARITTAGQITGDFSNDEVKGIVTVLRGGSLPTKPQLESESTVGSALGHDSIDASIRSMALGLGAVLVFMLVYYMVGGVAANQALILNILHLLGCVVYFRQDLTLPGIAGILLTVGMAVDANVLIYERVREERGRGKSIQRALAAAYQRAFWVIFDSNITTLLTGIVLFKFGTGPVRGFAVTLIIGIIVSFFTSIYVTRLVLSLLLNLGLVKDLRMMEIFKTPRVPFVAHQRLFFRASLILIAVTWFFVISRGQNNFGIDFNGGAQVGMNLKRTVKVEDMRSLVEELKAENPKLFIDYNLQTVGVQEGGASNRFILLARADESVGVAEAQGAPGGAGQAPAQVPAPGSDVPGSDVPVQLPAEVPTEAVTEDTAAEDAPPAAATQVRNVLEKKLAEKDLLLPPPFPLVEWVPDDAPGAVPGTFFLNLQVNLLEVQPRLTKDYLKNELTKYLEDDPRTRAAAAGDGAEYTGIRIESVERVPNEVETIAAYRMKSSSYRPPAVGSPDFVKIPSREQVAEVLRGYFTQPPEEEGQQLFVLAEPFSQVDSVSGSVASSLQRDAIVAIFIAMLGIVFYISLRFDFIYGLAAVAALLHDILISVGVAAVTDHFFSGLFPVKINLTEVAAILTIIGFSINDTIVIFDRVRENLQLLGRRKLAFRDVVDMSINQTLSRTIWTSLTTFLVVLVLLGFGGIPVRGFAFIFCVGIVSGTYSTIFVAGPIVIWLHERSLERRRAPDAVGATA